MGSGIVALIDYRNKRAYLTECTNICAGLVRQKRMIASNSHPAVQKKDGHLFCPYLVITVDDHRDLRYAYVQACEQMTNEGITVLSRSISYRVGILIQEDFRGWGGYLSYVCLFSGKRTVDVLGVFQGGLESEEFIDKHYPGKKLDKMRVVKSDNPMSVLYFTTEKERRYSETMDVQ